MKAKLDYAFQELSAHSVDIEILIELLTMYAKLYNETGELEFGVKADKILNLIGEEAKFYIEDVCGSR